MTQLTPAVLKAEITTTLPDNTSGQITPGNFRTVLTDMVDSALPVDSPAMTGAPTAPTATAGDNTTKLATTAFVTGALGSYLTATAIAATYAPLASPALTGTPTAPTAAGGTNTTQIATTAFVTGALGSYLTTAIAASTYAPLVSPALTGTPTAPTPTGGDNSTKIATTAFVTTAVAGGGVAAVLYTSQSLTQAQKDQALANLLTSTIVDRSFDTFSTYTTIQTPLIPYDNTTPQVTEGTQIFSKAFTPKNTTNRLRVRCIIPFATASVTAVIAAMFVNGGANAVRSNVFTPGGASYMSVLVLEHEFVPGSTSAQTISIRVGPNNAVNVYLNGDSTTGALFNGTLACTLIIEELKA